KLSLASTAIRTTKRLGEEALLEREGRKKIRIGILAITHGDYDHILSKKRLKARFEIENLMDNGRSYANPSEALTDYLEFREEMHRRNRYRPIRRATFNIIPEAGVELDALCPNRDIGSDEDPNNQCL